MLAILVPVWFIITSLVFFYLTKLLFYGLFRLVRLKNWPNISWHSSPLIIPSDEVLYSRQLSVGQYIDIVFEKFYVDHCWQNVNNILYLWFSSTLQKLFACIMNNTRKLTGKRACRNKRFVQVIALYSVFHNRVITKQIFRKLEYFSLPPPCLCPSEGHKYGRHKMAQEVE